MQRIFLYFSSEFYSIRRPDISRRLVHCHNSHSFLFILACVYENECWMVLFIEWPQPHLCCTVSIRVLHRNWHKKNWNENQKLFFIVINLYLFRPQSSFNSLHSSVDSSHEISNATRTAYYRRRNEIIEMEFVFGKHLACDPSAFVWQTMGLARDCGSKVSWQFIRHH